MNCMVMYASRTGKISDICNMFFKQLLLSFCFIISIRISDTTYVGCFKEDFSNREFFVGGGAFNFNNINPKLCRALCKAIDYKYAALQNGDMCLCGDIVETHSNGLQSGCTLRCAGNPTFICGGYGYSSVYSTTTSVKTLEISDPGYLEVFQVHTIQTTLADGSDGSEFNFDFGDNTGIAALSPGPQPHIYNTVGVYLMKAWVRNEDSGIIEARREVYVEAPISDLRTKCPAFVEVDHIFRCSSRVGHGTNIQATWQFNDGSANVEMNMADAKRFTVGSNIPRRLTTKEPMLGFDGIYVMPTGEVLQHGSIEAWEVFAVKEGAVILQVYRPLCIPPEKYCPYNRTCISKFWPCPPATEQFCDQESTAFCVKQQSCQPFEMMYDYIETNDTNGSTCGNMTEILNMTAAYSNSSVNNSVCTNYSTPYSSIDYTYKYGSCSNKTSTFDIHTPYETIGETLVTLQLGYNMIPLNVSQRIKVQPHDWIGFAPYHYIFPPYYPKAAYPPAGEIAHFIENEQQIWIIPQNDMQHLDKEFTESTAQKINNVGLYIMAYLSRPTVSWVSHSCSSSGMFEINIQYANPLGETVEGPAEFIASQYRIISIEGTQFTRDLGIYYACTDEPYAMHVQITQGTFVRFLWTFPDRSQTLTAPYLTNGISDGPGIITPDSLAYHFDKIGNYTTNVRAYNNISSTDISLFTIARYRITGLNGSVVLYPGDNTTYDWNLVMTGCWFNFSSFIVTGNVVQYYWDYGDGETEDWSFATIHQHFYSEPGVYTVLIKSDNIASVLDYNFDVTAAKPNFVHLSEYATSGIPTLMFCEVTWHSGDGLNFDWDFGDGNFETVINTGYVWHNYSTFDTYKVQCTITNYPGVSNSVSITVQDPVEGVVLENKTQVEATGDEVSFNVEWTRGNDVHFDWYFGDEITETTNKPTVVHIYMTIGYFEIKVNVSNMVSSMMSNTIIVEVQERITNVKVLSADNLILYPVNAQVSIDTGNKVWYDYDFGDGYRQLNNPSSSFTHIYLKPEIFTIKIHTHNAVSAVNATTTVQIDSRITGAVLQFETPHIRANALETRCIALNGSSVIMSIDWGDGSADGPFEADYHRELSLSDYIAFHTYKDEGTFNITCFMENPWTTTYTAAHVTLQEEITSVPFLPSVAVKGEIFDFEVLPFVGGTHSIIFRWDYNDGLRFTTMDFKHQYVYRNAGMYRVLLTAENLVSQFTTSQDFFVQEYIEGFQMLHNVQPVVPGSPTIISWQIQYGTDVIYTVDLGDNTSPAIIMQTDVGNIYSLNYIYEAPGSYNINVTAVNRLNFKSGFDTAFVEFPITGLKAYIRGNSTTHTDRSSYIIIEIEKGTNVEYTCDFQDGSMPIITIKQYCKHMFIALGPHIVIVKASNHLSNAMVMANETYLVLLPPIPHVIRGLEIEVSDGTVLGEPTSFMMYRYRGNRFNCTWQFGDNSTLLTDVSTVYSPVIHTYSDVGVYIVWLVCDNFYHPPVYATAMATVQIPPSGFNLTNGFVGQYLRDVMFNISLEAGTDVEAVLNYMGYEFPVAMNVLEGFVIVPASYVNESGWIDIVFTVQNLVPPILIDRQAIYIEAEIAGLIVWADKPYVALGSIVTFYAAMRSGTNVILEWNFGTNVVVEANINSTTTNVLDKKQHLYTELGLYAVFVNAYNEIGTMTHTPILIAVENSVKGFSVVTDSPVIYPDGIITFNCYWDTLIQILPTNATIHLEFGVGSDEEPFKVILDSLERITLFREYNNLVNTDGCHDIAYYNPFCESNFTEKFMSGTKLNILTVNQDYTPGVYTFTLTVYNLVSEQVLTKRVETQVPMVNLSIVTHNSQRPGVAHKVPGGGPLQKFYPVEYPVHFEAQLDLGTGSRFFWRLGDGGIVSTTELHIQYSYFQANTYSIRLMASNVFGITDAFATVVLQESVLGLFAGHSGATPMNVPVTVILFAAQIGSSSSYALHINGTNYTSSIEKPAFDEELIDKSLDILDPNIYLPFDPFTHAVTFHSLVLDVPGNYLIELEGSNFASFLSTSTTIHITEEPCQLPHILIYGGSKIVSNPWKIKKSHAINLISDVSLNCSSTHMAFFHWDAYIVEFFNGEPLPSNQLYQYKLPDDVQTEESDLVIPRRHLDYATYLFQLTVTMDNEGKVSNKNQTYVEVIPSPLFVRIAGGLLITVQDNATVVLNASMSHDPDFNMAEHYAHSNQSVQPLYKLHGLQIEWYCKLHQNGSFPFELGYIQNDDSCMVDGPGLLARDTDVLIIPLANLTASNQYIFAAVLKKEGRLSVMATQKVSVLVGKPPQLDIRCVRNCKNKVNPQKDLALAVDCANCKNDTVIRYKWTIQYSGGVELQSAPGYQDYIIGHRSRYLQIHSLLFTDRATRVLSVSVRGDWSRSRSYGHSQYEFVIGAIPTQGNCSIDPKEGVALHTQFIIQCKGFDSDEKPLHYEYLYSIGQDSFASVSSQGGFHQGSTAYSILFHSPEGISPSVTLPIGLYHKGYIVDIRVNIIDAIGATFVSDMHVQVNPPDKKVIVNEISSLKDENGTNTLELFLGKGDTQSATKLLTTLAMVMNMEEEITSDSDEAETDENQDELITYKTEVRAMLVNKLSGIPVYNLDAAKQTSAALTQAILKPEELDSQTQTRAADAYLYMLEILEEEAKEGTSLDILEDASKYFFSGAFSLLEASSGQATVFFHDLQGDPEGWAEFWDARQEALNETEMPVDVPSSLGLISGIGQDLNVPDMDEIEQEPWVPEKLQMSRNVTKKVFQIIDRMTSTLLMNKLPGEPALVIQTDTTSLILKRENLEEKIVRLYHTSDGTWFKLPTDALRSLKTVLNEDDLITQVFSSADNPFSWHLSAYEVKTSVISLSLKTGQGIPLLVSDLPSRVEMLIPHIDTFDSVQDLGSADVSSKEFSFFHFNLSDSHTSIHIDIQPTDGITSQLKAWLRYGIWPTENVYDLKLTLPLSSEQLYSTTYNATTNLTTNPYTWFIAENELYAVGSYYIGVKVQESAEERDLFREMNSTVPEELVNVNVKIYTARCLYWSAAYEQWFPYGCQVGKLTTASLTHCLCNHLTSFGGSFLIPTKKQLYVEEEVIIFIEVKETLVPLYVVSGTGGLLLVCLLLAYIADNRHNRKIFGGITLPGNCYIVTVFTGMEYTASTTAKMAIILHSADNSSSPHHLVNKDNHCLRSGCIDTFLISTKMELGKLTKISLVNDGGGFSPNWHVSRVMVEEYTTGKQYYFLCNALISTASKYYTFRVANKTMLTGRMHLFDTIGTSERFGRLVPLWYLMRRPLVGWFGAVECIAVVFIGMFAFLLGVVVINEFIISKSDVVSQKLTWMLEIDDIMTSVQTAILVLPIQYILLGVFSSVHRRVPTCCMPKECAVIDHYDGTEKRTLTGKRKKYNRPKKQTSLEEIQVESKTKVRKQTFLHEINVDFPATMKNESEYDSETSTSFESVESITVTADRTDSKSLSDVGSVSNVNQNASSSQDFNSVKLPDVVLATTGRSGPMRWSLLRHRKQKHLQVPIDHGNNAKREEPGRKTYGNKNRTTKIRNPQKQRKLTVVQKAPRLQPGQQTVEQQSSKYHHSKKEVENLGPSYERYTTTTGSIDNSSWCCTTCVDYLVQCLSKTCLPWCCGFLIWPCLLLLLVGSGFLTTFLTFTYPEALAYKWMLTVASSALISNLLIQPLLGIILSVLSCLCRKPGSLSITSTYFELHSKYKYTHMSPDKIINKESPRRTKLLGSRKLQTSPTSMTGIHFKLRVLLQIFFLAITLFVVYSRHDPNVFHWNQVVKDMFISGRTSGTRPFNKVHTAEQFWDWANLTLLPSVGAVTDSEFPYEHLVFLQPPRMRQFRVNQTSAEKCPDINVMLNWISGDDSCSTFFSRTNEDTKHYQSGWEPSPSHSDTYPNGYQYFRSDEFEGIPYSGTFVSYTGGGYPAQLGHTSTDIQANINALSKSGWIDGKTKSVALELIVYNTQVNLTSIVQLVLEMLPTGVADTSINILTITDIPLIGNMWVHTLIHGAFCITVIFKIGCGTASVLEHGREYFSTLPHLLSFLDVLISVAAAAFLLLEFLNQDMESYISATIFDLLQVYLWQSWISLILACLVFIISMHALLYLRVFKVFQAPIYILQNVLYETCKATPMYAFAIMAFAYPGWMQFSTAIQQFHTIWASIQSVHNLLVDSLYWDITEPTMTYFIMCFEVVMHLIILITFCAVIIQTYKSTKVQETLSQLINFGQISKLARAIRNRMVTKRIHRNVRLRKAIIARGWRRGRNHQLPVSYNRQLVTIQKRTEILLQQVHKENDTLFCDVPKVVKMSQIIVRELTPTNQPST